MGEKRTPLGPGDLAVLFREAPYELSFKELCLQVLIDGKPLSSEDIDLAYVGLSEQGHKAKKDEASDTLLKVALGKRFHAVRRYLESLTGSTLTWSPTSLQGSELKFRVLSHSRICNNPNPLSQFA